MKVALQCTKGVIYTTALVTNIMKKKEREINALKIRITEHCSSIRCNNIAFPVTAMNFQISFVHIFFQCLFDLKMKNSFKVMNDERLWTPM